MTQRVNTQGDTQAMELLIARAQQGDAAAMEALMDAYRPLLRMLARRMACTDIQAELEQAGYIGLMQAARHFDAHRAVRFITYAVPWVLGEMRRALRQTLSDALSVDDVADGEDRTPLVERLCGQAGIDMEALDLRMALERLTQEEQTLICLRFYRDKTQQETAYLLKKSQAQVCRLERRALDRLRGMLAQG